jgi:hypothetical protein
LHVGLGLLHESACVLRMLGPPGTGEEPTRGLEGGACLPTTLRSTPLQACQPATLLPKLGSCRRETAPIISCPAHRAVSLLYVVRPARCQPATQTSQSACMTLSNWSKSAGSLSGIADASNPTFQHPRPGDEREYLCQPSQPSDAYLATSQQGRVVWARR